MNLLKDFYQQSLFRLNSSIPTFTFSEIAPQLQTGDIVLFHGTEFISRIIEGATLSKWSHVAMIIRSPSQAVKDAYNVYQWHDKLKEMDLKREQDQLTQQLNILTVTSSTNTNARSEIQTTSIRERIQDKFMNALRKKKHQLILAWKQRESENKENKITEQNVTVQTTGTQLSSELEYRSLDEISDDDLEEIDDEDKSKNNENEEELIRESFRKEETSFVISEHETQSKVLFSSTINNNENITQNLSSTTLNTNTNTNTNNNDSDSHPKTLTYPINELDDIYIFESDTETFDKRKGGGVQLIPFRFWLETYWEQYKGKMLLVVRRLVIPWRLGNDNIDFPGLEEWLLDFPCVSYEKKKRSLVGSVLKTNRVEDFSSMFCSELVAATLKVMKLLPDHLISSNFLPKDFASNGKIDKKKLLLRDCGMEKEERVISDFL